MPCNDLDVTSTWKPIMSEPMILNIYIYLDTQLGITIVKSAKSEVIAVYYEEQRSH